MATITFKNPKKQQKNQNKPKPKGNKQPKITTIGKALIEGGRGIGSLFGLPSLGGALGKGVARVFGQGDYYTNMPMQNSLMSGGPPAFSALTSGFRLKHREYIGEISSSIAFTTQSYQINPGLKSTFPYLSQIAQNFETYKIHGMIIYLNSSSATAVSSTNTALGTWGVVTQYDPTEPPFTTKQQAENYVGCQVAVPSNSIMHGVECKNKANVLEQYYVRNGNIGAEDLKFYDHGKFQIFTQGSQAVSTIGELWISYDIEFFKPRLAPYSSQNIVSERMYLTPCSAGNCFGPDAIPTPLPGSNVGVTFNSSRDTMYLPADAPAGYYLLLCRWAFSSGTTGTYTWTPGGSISLYKAFNLGSNSDYYAPVSGSTASSVTAFVAFQKTELTVGSLQLAISAMPASATCNYTLTMFNPVSLTAKNNSRFSVQELEQLRALLDLHKDKLAQINPITHELVKPEEESIVLTKKKKTKVVEVSSMSDI